MASLESEAAACTHVEFGLQGVVVDVAGVGGGEDATPIGIRLRVGIGRRGAGLDLVEIDGLAHAVGAHAQVAFAKSDIGREFAFNSEVPLGGLWVAVIGERILVEVTGARDKRGICGCPPTGKLIGGLAAGEGIGGRSNDGDVDVGGVERELAEVGHREDAETSTEDGPAVAERAVGKTEARLKIPAIELTKAGAEADFVGVFDRSARHVGGGAEDGDAAECDVGRGGRAARVGGIVWIGRIATIDAGQESGSRLIAHGNDDATILNVEGGEIVEVADEGRKSLPAETECQGKAIAEAEFVLRVDACLRGVRMDVGAGLRDVGFGGQAEKKVCEGVAREDALVKGEGAKIVGAAETFQVLIADTANVGPKLHCVASFDPGEIVCELNRLRFGDPVLVASDRRIVAGVIAEIEDGESASGGMVAEVEVRQTEIGNCGGTLNWEFHLELPVGEAEARFVHQIVGDEIVVGNDEVIVVLRVLIGRQEIVDGAKRRIG